MRMERKCYSRPECQVFCIENNMPLLGQSQYDFVEGSGFIQVVNDGDGVPAEQGI